MQGSYLEDLPGSAKLSPQAGQAKLDISMVAALIKVWYLACSTSYQREYYACDATQWEVHKRSAEHVCNPSVCSMRSCCVMSRALSTHPVSTLPSMQWHTGWVYLSYYLHVQVDVVSELDLSVQTAGCNSQQ